MSDAAPIGFIGLGRMGQPMAGRLAAASYVVGGFDLSEAARAEFAKAGGVAVATAREAAKGVDILITMLPDAAVVREALLGKGDAAAALAPGSLIVDMSSSAPLKTRRLGEELAERAIALIDAPVSGGVSRAKDGSLAIMVGGAAAAIERARPLLGELGRSIIETGPLGSGHALKALNNYVSASGLVAACEALVVGEAFGLEPQTIVEVLNASARRNNSTETKLKPFVLSRSFGSGFAMALMAKDIRTAAELASDLGVDAREIRESAELWDRASMEQGKGADHTAIYRYLSERRG